MVFSSSLNRETKSVEEEFVEMHVEKSPMDSTQYFWAVCAVLKMSFPKASTSGDGEEMSFHGQTIQSLEKRDIQMLWWSIYRSTSFLNINKCYILRLTRMQLVGVTRTQQKAFQQSSWLCQSISSFVANDYIQN